MANEILIDQSQDHQNVARIINLPNALAQQEPATLAQLEAAIQNIKFKSAQVAPAGNINIAAPGATVDGYAPTAGDVDLGAILLIAQTNPAENGLWVWNGAAAAMTRHPSANTSEELTNAVVEVVQGTNAGVAYRQGAVQPVVGTTAITFGVFNGNVPAATEAVAGKAELATQAETDAGADDARIVTPLKLANWSGRKRKGTVTIGDGVATQFSISHNFGTRDVVYRVWEVGGTFRERTPSAALPDTNTLQLNFATAPASNSLRVTLIG